MGGMLSRPVAQPKPKTRLTERHTRKRELEEKARVFRSLVWARDRGRCVVCGRAVKRTLGLDPLRGEVHHLRGRNVAPEERCNPRNGVLVCLLDHLRLTRHEIELPKPKL
jgi:hypothetical protein